MLGLTIRLWYRLLMIRFSKPRRFRILRPLVRLLVLLAIAALIGFLAPKWATSDNFACPAPHVVDGDTFHCGDRIVRLEGIDAPEREGQCQPGRNCAPGDPNASTAHLRRLIGGRTLQCVKSDTDQHGRTVARCSAGDIDLSCAQLKAGQAVARYATILCLP